MRLLPTLIGLLNIALLFIIARRLFSLRTAIIASLLMSIAYWHVFASYMTEMDGSFMMSIYLIAFALYFNYRDSDEKNKEKSNEKDKQREKRNWFILLVLWCMFAIIFKISAVFIPVIIAILFFFDNRVIDFGKFIENVKSKKIGSNLINTINIEQLKKTLFQALILLLSSAAAYVLLFVSIYYFSPGYFNSIYSHLVPAERASANILFGFSRIIAYLVLWGSPLLFGVALFSIIYPDYSSEIKKNMLPFVLWIIIPVLGYSFGSRIAAVDRYLAVIIPALCLLSALFIDVLLEKTDKTKKTIIACSALLFFLFLNFIASFKYEYIVHDLSGYMRNAISLKWNFWFPFYGAGGPVFLVPFLVIAASLSILFSLFIISAYFIRKKQSGHITIILFIGISIAFSLFIAQEFLFQVYSPNIYGEMQNSAKYLDEVYKGGPVYSTSPTIKFYSKVDETKFIHFDSNLEKEAKQLNQTIHAGGGTIVWVDYPKLKQDSLRAKLARQCTLLREFKDKNITIVKVYDCNNLAGRS